MRNRLRRLETILQKARVESRAAAAMEEAGWERLPFANWSELIKAHDLGELPAAPVPGPDATAKEVEFYPGTVAGCMWIRECSEQANPSYQF